MPRSGASPPRKSGLDLPEGENMTRAEYRDQLQMPLLKFLEKEKLFVFEPGGEAPDTNAAAQRLKESKIRYAVLCYGVPLRILDDPQLAEPGWNELPPNCAARNGAAVDSELTLLPEAAKESRLAGPLGQSGFCRDQRGAYQSRPGRADGGAPGRAGRRGGRGAGGQGRCRPKPTACGAGPILICAA
jgi:uncharacterized protein (TIGR03790 family)